MVVATLRLHYGSHLFRAVAKATKIQYNPGTNRRMVTKGRNPSPGYSQERSASMILGFGACNLWFLEFISCLHMFAGDIGT